MLGGIKRAVATIISAGALAACGLQDSSVFNSSFWSISPLANQENDEAELGLAELAKGNYVGAEGYFQKALRANPKDVYALLGAGVLYQNTGQATKAREMYEAILAIRPKESVQIVPWNTTQTRPIGEIASVNLSLLDSGATVSGVARGAAGVAPGTAPPPSAQAMQGVEAASRAPVAGAPVGAAMLGRSAAPPPPAGAGTMASRAPLPPAGAAMDGQAALSNADANIASRFATLKALRDQGLITQEEFNVRRQANIGALLPLTSPPPAAGLDRPVPNTEQIAQRLRAIGRALEMRALTVTQHASERSMILDALAPAAPVVVANAGAPPRGLMEAADNVRRLEQLREGGYISSDEYTRERKAIEMAMGPPADMAKPAGAAAAAGAGEAPAAAAKAKAGGPQPAVHLASYRSRDQAEKGWQQLQRAHGALLGKLQHEVSEINLGAGKGKYYRLKAGPLADKAEAATVCRQLKQRRQYCEPTFTDS